MFTRLHDVLEAVVDGRPAATWSAAAERIERERVAVEQMLRSFPDRPVYGFTTLLGPLDGVRAGVGDTSSLLRAHLLGPTEAVSPAMSRLITSVKLAQLSAGGAGISPRTYARLLDAVTDSPPCRIAWAASYGSADVVPAAWWARAVAPDAELLETGDLVALLNGHFVSTAHAVATLVSLLDYVSRFCAVAGTVVTPTVRAGAEALAGDLAASMAANHRSVQHEVQLPVSVRDSAIVAQPVVRVLTDVAEGLEQRLTGPSANPLFVVRGGVAEAVSQASFLDIGLTLRLGAARQFLLYCMGLTQRFTEVWCDRLGRTDVAEPRHVQPPKVSQALLEGARVAAGPVAGFSGSQSGGVEDVWDGSLLSSRSLAAVVDLAAEQLGLLESVLELAGVEQAVGPEDVRQLLLAGLGLAVPPGLAGQLRGTVSGS